MQKISFTKAFWKAIDADVTDLVDFLDDHYPDYEVDGFFDYMTDEPILYNALVDTDHWEAGFDTILFNQWLESKTA